MTAVRLAHPDLPLIEAALAGDAELSRALGVPVVEGWATFAGALEATRTRLQREPSASAWGTRLFVAVEPAELVGWGGFKGPPSQSTVELGYEIAESRRGRGLATASVERMLEEAFAGEEVTRVIAHTLPERNASNRVLEKAGFVFDGEARERGKPVWRFARGRSA